MIRRSKWKACNTVRSVRMGVPDAQKMDGSELRNTLERTEHGKGMEVQNRMREVKRYGTYSVGVKDLASAYVLCPRLAECRGLSIYGWAEFTG